MQATPAPSWHMCWIYVYTFFLPFRGRMRSILSSPFFFFEFLHLPMGSTASHKIEGLASCSLCLSFLEPPLSLNLHISFSLFLSSRTPSATSLPGEVFASISKANFLKTQRAVAVSTSPTSCSLLNLLQPASFPLCCGNSFCQGSQ